MMVGRTPILSVLLVSVGWAGPEQDPKEEPEFIQRVDDAILKGVVWLRRQQTATGRFPAFEDTRGAVYELGMHALGTLTLIKGTGDPEAKECLKALRQLDILFARHKNRLYVYEAGLTLMVLDAKYHTEPGGQKNKNKKKKRRKKKRKIDPKDLATANHIVRWLQTKQRPEGMWRYPEGGVDLSNTQYAALGLWSAHRLGVAINKGVARRMLRAILERQQPAGHRVPFYPNPKAHRRDHEHRSSTSIDARGWRYLPEEHVKTIDGKSIKRGYPYSGSMTSAGVAILAIGRDLLGKDDSWLNGGKDAQIRRAMWEGLAWLQSNWELRDNPGQPGNWPFYWIYGLERCARLAGVEYVGQRDWYLEGAERLLGDQRPDGAWPLSKRNRPKGDQNVRWWSDQVDTCFAILFLTRSTPEIETPPPAISGN